MQIIPSAVCIVCISSCAIASQDYKNQHEEVQQSMKQFLKHLQSVKDRASADAVAEKIRDAEKRVTDNLKAMRAPQSKEEEAIFEAQTPVIVALLEEIDATANDIAAHNWYQSEKLRGALENGVGAPTKKAEGIPQQAPQTLDADEQRRHDEFMKKHADTFSGGNGMSMQTAVIIHSPGEYNAVPNERLYWSTVYPGSSKGLQTLIQGEDGKIYDQIVIHTEHGSKTLYFDITADLLKLNKMLEENSKE